MCGENCEIDKNYMLKLNFLLTFSQCDRNPTKSGGGIIKYCFPTVLWIRGQDPSHQLIKTIVCTLFIYTSVQNIYSFLELMCFAVGWLVGVLWYINPCGLYTPNPVFVCVCVCVYVCVCIYIYIFIYIYIYIYISSEDGFCKNYELKFGLIRICRSLK